MKAKKILLGILAMGMVLSGCNMNNKTKGGLIGGAGGGALGAGLGAAIGALINGSSGAKMGAAIGAGVGAAGGTTAGILIGKKMDKALTRQDIPHWFIRLDGIGHEVADWLPGSVDLFCTFVDLTFAGRITTLDATMTDSGLKPVAWAQMNMFRLYGGKRK